LAPSGCSEISLTNSEQSLGTRLSWWLKATTKKKTLIMKKPFHLLQRLRPFEFLIAFAAHMEFKLYQMDVKSALLNGYLKEDVYVM